MKFKKQNQNIGTQTCIVCGYCSFVDYSNLTYKANSHTSEVEIHTRQKLRHFGRYVAKAKLYCQEISVPVTQDVHMGKFSSRLPRSRLQNPEISVTETARLLK